VVRGHPYRHTDDEPSDDRVGAELPLALVVTLLVIGPILYVAFDAMLVRTTIDNVRTSLFVLAALFGVVLGARLRALASASIAFVGTYLALDAYETWILRETVWDAASIPALAGLAALMAIVTSVVRFAGTTEPPLPDPLPIDCVPDSQRPLIEAVRRRRARPAR
jgi:hypothetical protein